MAVLTLLCWRAVLDRSAGDRGLLTEGEKGPPCSSGRSLDKGGNARMEELSCPWTVSSPAGLTLL